MDPHISFATRDELWHLQTDMKSVFSTQADHTDRLSRLERKLEEDNRVKSVWGSSSPFPSALGGTPQHGKSICFLLHLKVDKSADPGYNPAAEAFKSFDQEQNNNLLGSLHIDGDDEPRRGASRANSVRFDESALQGQGGHFGHTSRSSSEFFPLRTGGGLGGVSMLERSSSHKSDGRQSSTHSTRLNSLALDSRSPALEGISNMGPPPGLLLLGPHPSIIRCWLDSNFSNDSLLYAAVCTGSHTSMISSRIAQKLGLFGSKGRLYKASLTVYFPEATISQASMRAVDLIPQVPSISADFEVLDVAENDDSIQVIIGSDVLRIKNADVSFSQERVTLFDDEHRKLAIPLVRPENPNTFQRLRTSSNNPVPTGLSTTQARRDSGNDGDRYWDEAKHNHSSLSTTAPLAIPTETIPMPISTTLKLNTSLDEPLLETPALSRHVIEPQKETTNGIRSSTPTREKEAAMWGNWRRDANPSSATEATFSSVASNANSQSSTRGRGMKVLRPSRSTQPRSTSTGQSVANTDPAPPRWPEPQSNRGAPSITSESGDSRLASPRRSFSSDTRNPFSNSTQKPRPANPVGGASAFGWLNSGQK